MTAAMAFNITLDGNFTFESRLKQLQTGPPHYFKVFWTKISKLSSLFFIYKCKVNRTEKIMYIIYRLGQKNPIDVSLIWLLCYLPQKIVYIIYIRHTQKFGEDPL